MGGTFFETRCRLCSSVILYTTHAADAGDATPLHL